LNERDGLARERVVGIQRARIVSAMIEVASEKGLVEATVGRVVDRAGVSRRTFYEIFEDREQCFLSALDTAIASASDRVLETYVPDRDWRERVRRALVALLAFLEDEPGMGRLLVVESLGAGPQALECRSRVLAQLIAAVDSARSESNGSGPPSLTAEGVVGAALSVIHARMIEHASRSLLELTGPLMSMIVLPYYGKAAAKRELDRPVLPIPHTKKPVGDPLSGLEMRLTYRTVRVLLVIGAHPGASNRQIGLQSGVEDQGQISKLLARLERIGLIQNTGAGATKGAPNAWTLTNKGKDIHQAITTQTTNTAT
jgi:AcrR family transcriptional regulator/DNA-binding MarR family transcriptional regulator